MKITSITVSAGRTFNHPHEQYSNLRPEVVLHATLADGDDALSASKVLQAQAEQLVEDHKNSLLKSIEELHQMSERNAEVIGLQRQLTCAQTRIDEIRKEWPALAQLTLKGD